MSGRGLQQRRGPGRADHPILGVGVRLRVIIAARLGITERSAYGIVTGLAEADYVGHAEGRPP